MASLKYPYGKPETIFINKERSTCKGCAFLDEWEVLKASEFCHVEAKKFADAVFGEKRKEGDK